MFAQIRTKNSSAYPLRRDIIVPERTIVRLGSRTPSSIIYPRGTRFMEINTVESIENSRDKLRMKECFSRANVPQAEYYEARGNNTTQIRELSGDYDGHPEDTIKEVEQMTYPLVGKLVVGFKGHGMQLINNAEELRTWLRTHNNGQYYLEKFYNHGREYRLHATQSRVFLSWRKLRRNDSDQRWFFNSTNCNWVGEEHELFNRPSNWDEICTAAINAIRSVGLDIGCADIRVQAKNNPRFIVCEVNSAPALAEVGLAAYKSEIQLIANEKFTNRMFS